MLIAGIAQACGRIRVCVVRHNFPRRPVLRARPWGPSADLAAGRDTSLAFMRRYISVQAKTLGRGGEAQTAVLGVAFLVGTLFWAVMRWPAAYRPLDRQSSGRCGAARVRGLKSDNRTQRTRTRRFETARFVRLQIDPKINNLGRGNKHPANASHSQQNPIDESRYASSGACGQTPGFRCRRLKKSTSSPR